MLDFDDKSERNLCFSFGKLGIIFNGFFRPGRNGNSAGSEVTHRPMAAEINRCRLGCMLCIHTGNSDSRYLPKGSDEGTNSENVHRSRV